MAQLKAEIRDIEATKADLRLMRESGKVPAVVYGKKVTSMPIAVEEKQLASLLRSSARSILELDIPGHGKYPVMVNGVHRDTLKRNLLHIDFHQISMDEPVRATVSLEYTGDAPGIREGGVLTAVLHEIEVRCLPQQLPSLIEVDVSSLELGESFLAGQLTLPEGVELKTDENAVLATILVPQKAMEEEQPEAEAQPEAGRAEEQAVANE